MKSIEISVRDRVAWQTNSTVYICGNGDFEVVFAFDPEWSRYDTKTARFNHDSESTDVVFSGNKCTIPKTINATRLEVGVFAGELYATTPAAVRCLKSILCDSGAPADPLPDVYAQIMEMLRNGVNVASSPITRVESLEETGLRNLRELESGTYILYGYFTPYPGAEDSITIDNCIAAVVHLNAGSHVMVYNPRNFKIECYEILEGDGNYTYTRNVVSLLNISKLLENGGGSAKRVAEVYLPAAEWQTEEDGTYFQLKEIPTVTELDSLEVTFGVQQLKIMQDKVFTFFAEYHEDGVAKIYVLGDMPTLDYTVQVHIEEVVWIE